jgi:adenosylcobinamide kinase/adenosylcobinamide-phosphate guanylyltransferase
MSKVVLVTGGSRSGKSVLAEKKAFEYGEGSVIYLATAIPTDADMEERIRLHKLRRDSRWETHEGYRDLAETLKETEKSTALLDCITVFITNFMFEKERDFDTISKEEIASLQEEIIEEIKKVVQAARDYDKNLIMVTNEVGMSLVPSYRLGRIFSDINGKVNEILAGLADEVHMSVCGIPIQIK